MTYREFVPHPALSPFVDRFWTRSNSVAAGSGEAPAAPGREPVHVLPDGCIDILIPLEDGAEARVVGAMTRAVVVPGDAGAGIASVRFRPGGAAPFLRVSAHELTDQVVALSQLGLAGLGAGALARGSTSAAVVALERLLLQRLGGLSLPDRRIVHAVRALSSASPPSVEALARSIGWTRQHQNRAFCRHVGLGTKQFARVARLQRAVDVLQRQPEAALSASALELGYCDQAHMARELRELGGITAADARARPGSIYPIRSLLLEA